jgi:ACS family tartrate transporter-like MFS transporter
VSQDHSPLDDAVAWKVTVRLIPFLFILYLLNILDRINVGFARLKMLDELHMDEEVFGLGVGLFFIGYFVFEIPSNLILRRVGARMWIGRIMISWGLISAAMMFVRNPWSFYLLRLLLGIAEAGFFPGIILYLNDWFPAQQRARAVSRFMMASPLTGVFGYPLSGYIMQYTQGTAGLAGWQWLFLLEGIPSALMGLVVLRYLPDRPEHARWLTPAERAWLSKRMQGEEQHREEQHGLTRLKALADPRVLLLCLIYFTVAAGSNSFGAYVPKFLQEAYPGATEVRIGMLAAIPSLAAAAGMVLVGVHSDRTGERRWHVAGTAFVAAAGWVLAACTPVPALIVTGLAVAQTGMLSMLAPFWSLPTALLSGAAAAGGIALINSVGNLGGFVAPNVLGYSKTVTGSFSGGMLFLAAVLAVGGFLTLWARHEPTPVSIPAPKTPDEAPRAAGSRQSTPHA